MTLKELLEKLKALLGEAEAAAADANKEGADDAAKTAALAKYKAKTDEIARAKAHINQLKELAEHKKALAEAELLEAVVVDGKTIPAGKTHAEAKDHDGNERILIGHFADWMCGAKVSDRAMDALQPKAPGWDKAKTQGGVAVPMSIARAMLPEAHKFGVGKALPLTSEQASPSNLFQADLLKQLNMYEGEAPAIFPNTFKIPSAHGEVKWPQLEQGAPGAEGSEDEFAEYGFVACEWTGEGAEKPGTEPVFTQKDIKSHELAASTSINHTLLNRSSINIEAMLPTLFRGSLLHKIDLSLINGNGIGKPTGILQTAGIGAPARTTAAHVKYEDLVNLEFGIAPQFRGRARYVCADTALKNLRLKKDLQDRPLFLPLNAAITEGPSKTGLNGYPYVATQRTTLGAAGDMIFGDWSHYVTAVEQEIVIASSDHAEFKKRNRVFIAFVMIGGRCMQPRAFAKLPA